MHELLSLGTLKVLRGAEVIVLLTFLRASDTVMGT